MTKQIMVGLYLSCGYTTKEIANMTGKSFHTINQETRILYQKTGSRNLADIVCFMASTVTHMPVRELLLNTLQSA